MVIDPLEPYRKMARSIRFVPPLAQANRLQKQTGRPDPIVHAPEPQAYGWSQSLPLSQEATIDSVPDPSEHVAALVKSAVSQPTVLPVIPLIQENIGDRISRLKDSGDRGFVPVLPEVFLPKVAPVEQVTSAEWVQSIQEPIEAVGEPAFTIQAESVSETEPITEPIAVVEPVESVPISQGATSQAVLQSEGTQPVIQPPVEERSSAVELPVKPTLKASAKPKTASSKAAKSKAAPKKKTKGFGAKAK